MRVEKLNAVIMLRQSGIDTLPLVCKPRFTRSEIARN